MSNNQKPIVSYYWDTLPINRRFTKRPTPLMLSKEVSVLMKLNGNFVEIIYDKAYVSSWFEYHLKSFKLTDELMNQWVNQLKENQR